ncbi:MAG TPA: PP2C family protein-serine/threonine phosphatase, partial [Planctomycetaceae bacterium]|nr:PP2C family protein-serine/threonine phosphatase [Planctomycetaceae bacterium]
AGHPGYCLRADGSRATLPSTATVLGFSTRLTFPESAPLKLSSGDVLVLPTDGIQECLSEDGEFFGVDRLLGLVQADRHRPSAELAISVYQACQQFVGARPQQDDISLVVARVLDQS